MNSDGLVMALRRRGFTLRIDGAELVVRGPLKTLPPTVLPTLKDHKPAVLALLAEEAQERSELGRYHLARCGECRRIMDYRHMEMDDTGCCWCDDCRRLPTSPEQAALFNEAAPDTQGDRHERIAR